MKTLKEFLDTHKADEIFTHTTFTGNKYFIPDDDKGEFYKLYVQSIIDGEGKQYFAERITEIGPLRIDFDFIYKPDVTEHKHTISQVSSFCKAYMHEIKKYIVLPESVDIYVLEKRRPTLDRKNRMKSGVHIVVPKLCTHKFVEQRVRRDLVKTMDEHFQNLPLTESWDKIYDEGVFNRTITWTLYGSRKNDPDSLPYLVTRILNYANDEITISPLPIPMISTELISLLSLVRDESDETEMTEEAKKIYSTLDQPVNISGGKSMMPGAGRPNKHRPIVSRRTQPLDYDFKEYIKEHVMNLAQRRYTENNDWHSVMTCLNNIHPDLLDVFIDFSAQCKEKYNEADCIDKWNKFKYRTDGDRLELGSLRKWSREDNFDNYNKIESKNIERLVGVACSGTEYDVACVIYSKYCDEYVCCDFGKNVWYRWAGHIWKENDKGIDLQQKLSKEIATLFFAKSIKIALEMANNGFIACIIDGKKECGQCEYCKLESERKRANNVYMKLKTTKFKSNIMKECCELFFNESFLKLIDTNTELIACNNGVFDLTALEFRNGKPEDYLTFSTNIDYKPNKRYDQYEQWPKIQLFIRQVLTDDTVRDYFMKHLASSLRGDVSQKFYILTGSGSNGKSMIMNLMANTLGDYACTVPIALFTQKQANSGAAAPQVVRLKGRRFISTQEPDEAVPLNTSLVKLMTSSEPIYGRELFKNGTEFKIKAKFHLACNEKPTVNTMDGGSWRRLAVINFLSKFVYNPTGPNEFQRDEMIEKYVSSREWAEPFLNYLINIYIENRGLYGLEPPEKVLEYSNEYRNENDGISKFIDERILKVDDPNNDEYVEKTELNREFKQWRELNDRKGLQMVDMIKRIESLYGKPTKRGWNNFTFNMN